MHKAYRKISTVLIGETIVALQILVMLLRKVIAADPSVGPLRFHGFTPYLFKAIGFELTALIEMCVNPDFLSL